MAEMGPRAFLDLLKQSGLVEPAVLKKSLATLSAAHEGIPLRLSQITEHLLSGGLLTEWQRDKLLEGKHKGFFLGAYRLLRLLGTGGMSTVYLAEHRLSQHRRAIKVLPRQRVSDKSYLDRFYREGRAAAALNHPNIVRIYDLDHEDDIHFMVMEYVDGTDFQELVRRDGPLPVEQALDCLLQAAGGLKHAHERKIVHRDVKPSNLLAGPDGVVKVLDLGLALMAEGAESLTLLHNDRVMGTADYLAPEQALNSHEVDHRADIYSLGCTLYFLLTGQPPFPDGSIAQRIAAHQSREAPLVTSLRPDCPAILAELCLVMMRKSREDRIQSCKELIAEVRAVQAGFASRQPAKLLAAAAVGSAPMPLKPEAVAGNRPAAKPLEPGPEKPVRPDHNGHRGRENTPNERSLPAHRMAASQRPAATGEPVAKTSARSTPIKVAAAMDHTRQSVSAPGPIVAIAGTGSSGQPKVVPARGEAIVVPLDGRRTPGTRVRGKSVWLVAGVIGLMFAVLLGVLVIALKLVN